MNYPVNCNTPREKISYLYEAQERLQRLHNWIGTWHREGLTQSQYDQIPDKIKALYPVDLKLSKFNWDSFVEDEYNPRANIIISKIPGMKSQLKNRSDWGIVAEDLGKN